MLDVFIITQEEPFYIPKVMQHVLTNQDDTYKVVGYTCLKPHRKNKNMGHWFFERARIYSPRELLLASCLYSYCQAYHTIFAKMTHRSPYAVKAILDHFAVPNFKTSDVNSSFYVSKLRSLEIDVILSVSPPQLFGEALLSIPKNYALNAHGTLLPRHRGVFGSWWTIFSGDKQAGCTIHTMELRLDAGEIVWQRAVDLAPDETQFSVAHKTKSLMAKGIVEVLRKIETNDVSFMKSNYEPSYHRAPTRSEGKSFHRKGLRIIRPDDIRTALSYSFKF